MTEKPTPQEFITPILKGDRFFGTLPLDMASDLHEYEELIKQLAEHLWRSANPGKKNLPANFSKGFDLHIERIEKGSSKTVISKMVAAGLVFGAGIQDYHTQARDIVSEVIASNSGIIPPEFPPHLLDFFKKIGKSLKQDEYILFPRAKSEPAKLDISKRDTLVNTFKKTSKKTLTLEGTVGQIDWDAQSFRLNMDNGNHRQISADSLFFSNLENIGGNRRHRVIVTIVAMVDIQGNIQQVKQVKSIIVEQNIQIKNRLNQLSEMEDGWMGDGSKSPTLNLSSLFFDRLIKGYPPKAKIPAIFPTFEGNILLEWNDDNSPSLEISADQKTAFYTTLNDEDDMEFTISTEGDISKLWSFLEKNIPESK